MTITKKQYIQLKGLRMLVEKYTKMADEAYEVAEEITRGDGGGWLCDGMYGQCELDFMLDNMGIKVEEADNEEKDS